MYHMTSTYPCEQFRLSPLPSESMHSRVRGRTRIGISPIEQDQPLKRRCVIALGRTSTSLNWSTLMGRSRRLGGFAAGEEGHIGAG